MSRFMETNVNFSDIPKRVKKETHKQRARGS